MDSMLNVKAMSKSNNDQAAVPHDDTAQETFTEVLYYSVLILLLPITSFFVTKMFLLESILGYDSDSVSNNIIAAVVAVVVLHVALGMFIYKAYFSSGAPAKKRLGKQE